MSRCDGGEQPVLRVVHTMRGETLVYLNGVLLPTEGDLVSYWRRDDGLCDVDLTLVCRVDVEQCDGRTY